MVAAQTLPNLPGLTIEQAEHWIAAALAEAKALRQHDELLYPASDDPAIMQTARQLHSAWARWAEDAGVLYDHIHPLLRAGNHVGGAHDLEYAIARAQATVRITPESMHARRGKVEGGDFKTGEEVRRELRAATGR